MTFILKESSLELQVPRRWYSAEIMSDSERLRGYSSLQWGKNTVSTIPNNANEEEKYGGQLWKPV